jgi:ribosomal protein S18 acetylase RimI-like enzyme
VSDVRIEAATPADFLAIAALDRVAWLHTGEQFIADGEHVWRLWCEYATTLVARTNREKLLPESGSVAGAVVQFPTTTNEIFLHKIMVHPELRGQGIGTALMRSAIAHADRPLLLTVDPNNVAAVTLYQNFGFKVRQRIEGYYRPHEHRFLMVRLPGEPPTSQLKKV